jgi:hypothetical protein
MTPQRMYYSVTYFSMTQCYYGGKTLDCNYVFPSFYYSYRGFCPCSSFTCNGTFTRPPTPKPSKQPTEVPSSPSPVRWVLGREKESCSDTCRSAGADCLPYHTAGTSSVEKIFETAIDILTCDSASLTYGNCDRGAYTTAYSDLPFYSVQYKLCYYYYYNDYKEYRVNTDCASPTVANRRRFSPCSSFTCNGTLKSYPTMATTVVSSTRKPTPEPSISMKPTAAVV